MTAPAARRLVAITLGHSFGDRVLRRFETAGISLDVLIVTVQQNTVLTQVVAALTLRAEPLSVHPQSSRHLYGRWVSDQERAQAIRLLAAGEAVRLYEEWRAVVGSDELPDEDPGLPASAR